MGGVGAMRKEDIQILLYWLGFCGGFHEMMAMTRVEKLALIPLACA